MVNLADFSALLMIFVGPFCGIDVARMHKAGTTAIIVFGLLGLVIGFGVAMLSSKLAYSILRSKKLPDRARHVFYMSVPVAGLLAVAVVSLLAGEIFYGWR